jgi:hypothetical protein
VSLDAIFAIYSPSANMAELQLLVQWRDSIDALNPSPGRLFFLAVA